MTVDFIFWPKYFKSLNFKIYLAPMIFIMNFKSALGFIKVTSDLTYIFTDYWIVSSCPEFSIMVNDTSHFFFFFCNWNVKSFHDLHFKCNLYLVFWKYRNFKNNTQICFTLECHLRNNLPTKYLHMYSSCIYFYEDFYFKILSHNILLSIIPHISEILRA